MKRDLVKRLGKIVEGHACKPKLELNRDDKHLVDLYERLRRVVEPSYEAGPRNRLHLRQARIELLRRHLPRKYWPAYLDMMFEDWSTVAPNSRLACPPAHAVKSEFFLDCFLQTLGPRQLNTDKAAKLLRKNGFADVDPPIAVSVAIDVRSKGRPPRGLTPRYAEAGVWLAEHIHDVGYLDEV